MVAQLECDSHYLLVIFTVTKCFINTIINNFKIGYTPLHCASQNGHTDVVKLLIESGAQIDVSSTVREW